MAEMTFEQAEIYVNRSLAPSVRKRLQRYLNETGVDVKVPLSYVFVRKLPLFVRRFCDFTRGCYESIGKIFGYHNPQTDTEGMDPVTIEGYEDGEKGFLKRRGLRIPSDERVVAEELAHKTQRKTGALYQYSLLGDAGRGFIEGAAATIADRVAGKTGIYEEEKAMYQELERRVGRRDAFLGTGRALEEAGNILKDYSLEKAA